MRKLFFFVGGCVWERGIRRIGYKYEGETDAKEDVQK